MRRSDAEAHCSARQERRWPVLGLFRLSEVQGSAVAGPRLDVDASAEHTNPDDMSTVPAASSRANGAGLRPAGAWQKVLWQDRTWNA